MKKLWIVVGVVVVVLLGSLFLYKTVYNQTGPAGPLMELSSHGGLCPNGECFSTVMVNGSGQVLKDGKVITTISEPERSRLLDLVQKTDFNQIRSVKFTGTCPTAYDGQEAIYTFYVNGRVEELRSCREVIDNNLALFSLIGQIRQKYSF